MPPETQPATVASGADLAQFMSAYLRRPKVVTIHAREDGDVPALFVPDGYKAVDIKPILDSFRQRPERREGKTVLTTLQSFVEWTNRHRDDGTTIFARDDMTSPSLTAVIDHDEIGPELAARTDDGEPAEPGTARARFGRHRGIFSFPFSREWTEWMKISGKALTTPEFAEFIERRIGDVLPPPMSLMGDGSEQQALSDPEVKKLVATLGKRLAAPAELVTLSKGVTINSEAAAKVEYNRDTGEQTVLYTEQHGGTDRISPPNLFLLAIPVLNGGDAWTIPVHLRYRAPGGKIAWILELHQPHRVFEVVFAEALAVVAEGTTLSPLRGIAPDAR